MEECSKTHDALLDFAHEHPAVYQALQRYSGRTRHGSVTVLFWHSPAAGRSRRRANKTASGRPGTSKFLHIPAGDSVFR